MERFPTFLAQWDSDFIEDGRAFALAHFDADGRQEVLLKNRNGPQLRIVKNVMENLPPSIAFRLRGTKSNRDAIGAAVTVDTESGRQTRGAAGRFGISFAAQQEGSRWRREESVRTSIRWPSGLVQDLHDLPLNHRIDVEEGNETFRVKAFTKQTSLRGHFPAPPTRTESSPTTVGTWLLTPVTAPDISLPDLNGQVQALTSFQGNRSWSISGSRHRRSAWRT